MSASIDQRLNYLSLRGYRRVVTWLVGSEHNARNLELVAHRALMEAGYPLAGEGLETFEGDVVLARGVIERSMDAAIRQAKEEGVGLCVTDKRLLVRLSRAVHDQIRNEAKRRDVPVSRIVEEALREHFARVQG